MQSLRPLACARNIIENQRGLQHLNPSLKIRESSTKKRALVLVTTESHCLRDLLYLQELGELSVEIRFVLSNQVELPGLVESPGKNYQYSSFLSARI